MIYPMVTLTDPWPRFQGHGVIFRSIDALDVLCAQLTRDLFAIAKFLLDHKHKLPSIITQQEQDMIYVSQIRIHPQEKYQI